MRVDHEAEHRFNLLALDESVLMRLETDHVGEPLVDLLTNDLGKRFREFVREAGLDRALRDGDGG